MAVVAWQQASGDERALRDLLTRHGRAVRSSETDTSVDVGGVWRLDVDGQDRLVAVHGASGTTVVLASPPAADEATEGE